MTAVLQIAFSDVFNLVTLLYHSDNWRLIDNWVRSWNCGCLVIWFCY